MLIRLDVKHNSLLCVLIVKVNVFKDPVTDAGKKSKKGRLKLVRDSTGTYHTEQEIPMDQYKPDDPSVSCTQHQLVAIDGHCQTT